MLSVDRVMNKAELQDRIWDLECILDDSLSNIKRLLRIISNYKRLCLSEDVTKGEQVGVAYSEFVTAMDDFQYLHGLGDDEVHEIMEAADRVNNDT